MGFQTVFKRYEMKYLLDRAQKERLLAWMAPHMAPDPYGRSTVRNLYFDTASYRLIRRSLEHPVYKEKLRIRSYARLDGGDTAFVELKKKYKGVVYKRRLALPLREAMAWSCRGEGEPPPSQITAELSYFLRFYGDLRPVVFLSYEREAFYGSLCKDLRVTFDENILARQEALSLECEAYGTPLLPEGKVLMEVKCAGSIPLWMVEFLTRERLYKASFSKYGTAYGKLILPHTPYMKKENTQNV